MTLLDLSRWIAIAFQVTAGMVVVLLIWMALT